MPCCDSVDGDVTSIKVLCCPGDCAAGWASTADMNKSCDYCFLFSDINECLDETVCAGGQCLNTDGSYICFCTHPMVLDPSRNHCVLMPESHGENVSANIYI